MNAIGSTLRRAQDRLATDNARLEADVLLAHVLQCERSFLYAQSDVRLNDSDACQFEGYVQRRAAGEPLAYITKQREFWSLTLEVNHHTLIPRPDTETLVSHALELCTSKNARTLELGTGSGAIALALAFEKPLWKIDAVDVVPEAVLLAQRNQAALAIQNVCAYHSDWFASVRPEQFELILSNPPYIDSHDPHLTMGDVAFEPRTALVAANNGLADIFLIIEQAVLFLAPNAWLLLEHGFEQGGAVRAFMLEKNYVDVHTVSDLAGLPRVTAGRFPSE